MTIEDRLQLHREFWDGRAKRPLAAFRIGDYFIADKFDAALPLRVPGKHIEPHMLHVEDFLADYERQFAQVESIGQDGFWTAEPYPAIPWLEAILGSPILALERSFVAETVYGEGEKIPVIHAELEGNPWFEKLMEFVRELGALSKGRFPVGQPIIRGITEGFGALLGETRMVYELFDRPQEMKVLAASIEEVLLGIAHAMNRETPDYYGGSALGFYHVWTPGKCTWFQEDLTSLLSPAAYDEYLKPNHAVFCGAYEYNTVHMHSSSFHVLDGICSLKNLKSVEINKDEGGLSVTEMLPALRKVQASGKRLILWGMLTLEDLDVIRRELDIKQGVFFSIVAPDTKTAGELMEAVRKMEG